MKEEPPFRDCCDKCGEKEDEFILLEGTRASYWLCRNTCWWPAKVAEEKIKLGKKQLMKDYQTDRI